MRSSGSRWTAQTNSPNRALGAVAQNIYWFRRFIQERNMKKTWLALLFSALAGVVPSVMAQEKAKTKDGDKTKREAIEKAAEAWKEITSLRILVLFTEFDGEKKIDRKS